MTVDFSMLLGNESIKSLLAHQIETESVSHAYLIEGEGGTGKTTLARLLCAALACGNAVRPCGSCSACQKIRDSLSPDIITVETAADRKQITVDQIRALREEAMLSANELPIKAFLIEGADAMNPQAQNALLKVLEEPPRGVYFFLMTDSPSALLPTVRSRTVRLKTELFSDSALSEHLLTLFPEAQRLQTQDPQSFEGLIRRSGGSIGKAKELIFNRKKAFDSDLLAEEFLEKLVSSSHSEFLLFVSTLCKERGQFSEVLDRLLCAVRDLMIRKKSPRSACLFFRNPAAADTLSARFTLSSLLALHDLFLKTATEVGGNANVATALILLAEHARQAKER